MARCPSTLPRLPPPRQPRRTSSTRARARRGQRYDRRRNRPAPAIPVSDTRPFALAGSNVLGFTVTDGARSFGDVLHVHRRPVLARVVPQFVQHSRHRRKLPRVRPVRRGAVLGYGGPVTKACPSGEVSPRRRNVRGRGYQVAGCAPGTYFLDGAGVPSVRGRHAQIDRRKHRLSGSERDWGRVPMRIGYQTRQA